MNFKLIIAVLLVMMTILGSSRPAYAYNSYEEFLERRFGSKVPSFCFDTGNIMLGQAASVKQNCMPKSLGDNSCPQSSKFAVTFANVLLSLLESSVMLFAAGPLVATQVVLMLEICNSGFVLPYYEELMFSSGGEYAYANGSFIPLNSDSKVITESEVPYRFQCSDATIRGFNSKLCSNPQINGYSVAVNDLDKIGFYVDPIAAFRGPSSYQDGNKIKSPGSIASSNYQLDNRCNNAPTFNCGAADRAYFSMAFFRTYYAYDNSGDKVSLCVGTDDLIMPLQVGCVGVAPPLYEPTYDAEFINSIQGSRCQYLLMPRVDLHSLGRNYVGLGDDTSLGRFLQSDFHVTSTVVGCIKDLITSQVLPSSTGYQRNSSFLSRMQAAFLPVVYTILALYLTVVGIKIMTSPQTPPPSEWIMMLLKFALVFYFTTSSVWYSNFGGSNNNGLYGMMMDVPEEIGNLFMGILAVNDPMMRCIAIDKGSGASPTMVNLLGNNLIPASGVYDINNFLCSSTSGGLSSNCVGTAPNPGTIYGTVGFGNNVRTTIWDMVDCRIANYLNFGSCQYDAGGLVLTWFFGPSFIAGIIGLINGSSASTFIFFLVASVYVIALFLIILKIVHIFILSFIVITMLVLLAPLFICFALFPATSKMFDNWRNFLLGYMIYPGLLFAFVAIMFMTFDAVFYGYMSSTVTQDQINQMCLESPVSPYCMYVTAANVSGYLPDPCSNNMDLYKLFTNTVNLYLVKFQVFKLPGMLDTDLYMLLGKMLLFMILFYQYMSNFADVLASLAGLQRMSLGNYAMGSFYFKSVPDLNSLIMNGKTMGAIKSVFGKLTGLDKAKLNDSLQQGALNLRNYVKRK